jgi:antirestriction protein
LADYNAGRLHGAWISAYQDVEAVQSDIDRMLANSLEPVAEEWGIFDHDGFGPIQLSEYEDLATVVALARGIATYGPAFAHWAEHVDRDPERLGHFEDALLGTYPSRTDYVDDMLQDAGIDVVAAARLEPWVEPYVYVDSLALARDLEVSGEVVFIDYGHLVLVFHGHY